ncbi:hypothetical protein DCCM_2649 [Desulfocucumis palustris]|uniref:HTH merR-type domain-containing protein n=1 Tax=Desulfocucumis palustris TaxID=1898651 RepID=A0A2L2XB76_9FIRM|nr:hypothetical protein [Desulfocucumis palustris]GBF33547.1 hypothetical protein DCCM_2649 [Desulfocucumis palustris]
MPERWLSLNETARLAGLPEFTARRYANLFDDYLPSQIFGRQKKYLPEAVQILTRIESLYQEGFDTGEICDALSREIYLGIITQDGKLLSTSEAIAVMGKVIAEHSRVLQKLAAIMEKMAGAIHEIAANQEAIMERDKQKAEKNSPGRLASLLKKIIKKQ